MVRILVVDDHPIVREGLGRVLSSFLPEVIVGAADGGARALQRIRQEAWDLVLLDLTLGAEDGTLLLRRIRQMRPALPVVIISMHPAEQVIRRVLEAGAAGYVSKASDSPELIETVRLALSGRRAALRAPAAATGHRTPRHDQLSDREYQVLRMIGIGRTVSQIADELSLSVKTVSTYRSRILEKMNMRTSAELMRYAIEQKLVVLPPAD